MFYAKQVVYLDGKEGKVVTVDGKRKKVVIQFDNYMVSVDQFSPSLKTTK